MSSPRSLGKRQWDGTWDGIPAEIRLLIFQALTDGTSGTPGAGSLAALATVSREWQAEIGRHNFARIRLTLPRLRDFGPMTARNRTLVHYIWFCVELEEYERCDMCNPSFDTLRTFHAALARRNQRRLGNFSELKTNFDGFPITTAFEHLFLVLSSWDRTPADLVLDISVYSPSDSTHSFQYVTVEPDAPASASTTIEPSQVPHPHDHRHSWFSGVQLQTPSEDALFQIFDPVMGRGARDGPRVSRWWDRLPSVPAVTKLLLRQQTRRRWMPMPLAHLFSRFPGLEDIHYEPWREWDTFRQAETDQGACGLLSRHFVFFSQLGSLLANCPHPERAPPAWN